MTIDSTETLDYLDTIDPENYIVGVIHIPPGCNARNLLNAASQPTLNKFFRKLARHPAKKIHKILPTSRDSQIFELISEGEKCQIHMPFLGKSSKSGHCLRFLTAHRLQIHCTNKIDNNFDSSSGKQEAPEKSKCSSRKRLIPEEFTSPEDLIPIKKRRVAKSEL